MLSPILARFLYYSFVSLLLTGCVLMNKLEQGVEQVVQQVSLASNGDQTQIVLPRDRLYVLSRKYTLSIVDTMTWQVIKQTPTLQAAAYRLSQDPQGRIWIGYGASPGVDRVVQVYSPRGDLLKTFDLCDDPYETIHFAVDRAFVPCLDTGFFAAVVVIDLQSLEVETKIDIRIDGDTFTILSSSGNSNYFITMGGGTSVNHAALINTKTLELLPPIPLPPGTYSTLLSYDDSFFLLNANPSLDNKPNTRPDLVKITPKQESPVTTFELSSPGAALGSIADDILYVYHNINFVYAGGDPNCSLTRFDLKTEKSETWSLPTNWKARDLKVVDGKILLAHSITQEPDEQAGLYEYDPTTGKLSMLVNIPGATSILESQVD